MDNYNVSERIDGFVVNKGETNIAQDFFNYDTHIEMCYEYSNCQLLEPDEITDGNLGGVLLCYDWR